MTSLSSLGLSPPKHVVHARPDCLSVLASPASMDQGPQQHSTVVGCLEQLISGGCACGDKGKVS